MKSLKKLKNILLYAFFFLIGCQAIGAQSSTNDLPIIDISKKYPSKEKILQDMADIEYVALETTDDVLLSGRPILSAVSDKYILVHETLGDIFLFDRKGKIYSHFNHKGPSSQEYAWIGNAGTILDEKNEEIFVCAQSIQVYSLKGEYKRTLPLNTMDNELKVFNFDDNALLVYNGVIADPARQEKFKKNPYSLLSKKDGSIISTVDIHLPQRYSNRTIKTENNKPKNILLYYTHSTCYGQDFMIADISSDTLYLLTQNKKLTPILTRTPSVHLSTEPRVVWATFLTTDKFIQIGLITLDFNSKGAKIPILTYEVETGQISKMTIIDKEYGMEKWNPEVFPAIAKNMSAELYQASSIREKLKKNILKGNFEKFARTIDENDNPIIRIIKFK